MEAVGLPEYSIPFERATFNSLWPMVKDAWMKREGLSLHLSTVIAALQMEAKRNALIAKDLLNINTDISTYKKLTKSFDSEADTWAGHYNGATNIARPFISSSLIARKNAVLSFAEVQPGQRVLDLGCGPGVYGEEILTRGAFWYGMDISQAMLSYAHTRLYEQPNSRLLQGSSTFIPLKSSNLDVAICSGLIDYLSRDQLIDTIREVQRVLRPGGVLCITANLGDRLRWLRSRAPAWLPAPLRVIGPAYFHSDGLIKELEESGLFIEEEIRIRSKPFGGTLVVKATKGVPSTPSMEYPGASRQLL